MPAIRQKVVAPLILSFLQPRLRRPTHSLKEEEGAPLFFFAINSSFLCSYAVGFHWEGETFSEDQEHGFFRYHSLRPKRGAGKSLGVKLRSCHRNSSRKSLLESGQIEMLGLCFASKALMQN